MDCQLARDRRELTPVSWYILVTVFVDTMLLGQKYVGV